MVKQLGDTKVIAKVRDVSHKAIHEVISSILDIAMVDVAMLVDDSLDSMH
jgi:hypothetical protein